jgi:hypothetical protein
MSSGDFMNLTFRNTTTYRPDGSFIPDGYVFTVSSYGKQNWTNNLKLNSLTVSTFTLNSTFIVASTNTNNMVIFSTLVVSTTDSRNVTYSTLIGDTILTNNLSLNSNLNVGSTFTNFLQLSSLAGSSIGVRSVMTSTARGLFAEISSLSTGTHTAQTMTVMSTLSGSTMSMGGASVSTMEVSSLTGGAARVDTLLTTSSMSLTGRGVFSTLVGSTVTTNTLAFQSTLVGSSIQCVNLLSERATVNALTIPSTAVVSTATLNLALVSSMIGSTMSMGLMMFSSMIGGVIVGSTMTVNTILINSSLVTSTFATGLLNFSTLYGSSIINNSLQTTSTATISTTTTSTLVVNRMPTTPATPAYKLILEQGPGQDENAMYIGNSNGSSDQGLSIGMVNQGFSYFASYAKIQGKRAGSAGTTNLVLQSDGGKIGVGTTNPDALVDVYAPSGTPGTMYVYNGFSGTNSSGGDVTVAAINMGTAGSGIYYDSIRIRIPNGSTSSGTRLDLCTPNTAVDNTQITRMSVMPYTGYVGIGTTTPGNLLHINSNSTNLAAIRLTSNSMGWGSGMVFENTTAMTGRSYGIYTDSLMGLFRFYDVTASIDRMVIDSTGQVGIGTVAPTSVLHIRGSGGMGVLRLVNSTDDLETGIAYYGKTNMTGANVWIHGINSFGVGAADWAIGNANIGLTMALKTDGKVGIGTIAPTVLLDVYGSNPTLRICTSANTYASGTASLLFDTKTASYPLAEVRAIDVGVSPNVYRGDLAFRTQYNTTMTERMRITNEGSVGIGTATPAGIFHIYHATSTSYRLYIDQGFGVSNNGIYVTNSNYGSDQGLAISMVNAGSSNFNSYAKIQGKTSGVGGTTHLSLQTDGGSVGIGTASPQTLFHVAKAVTTDADDSLMTYYENTQSGFFDWAIGPKVIGGNGLFCIKGGSNNAPGSLSIYVTVNGSGNVGIGTTNPLATLDARGSIFGNGIYSLIGGVTTGNGYTTLQSGSANNTGYVEFRRAGGVRDCYIGFGDTGAIYFNVEQARDLVISTSAAERMRIKSDGKVGVGTASPNGTFHVYSPYYDTVTTRNYTMNITGSDCNNGNGALNVYAPSIRLKAPDLTWSGVRVYGAEIVVDGGTSYSASQSHGEIYLKSANATRLTIHSSGVTATEMYVDSWFRINGNNNGLYWQNLARGITSPEGAGNTYGNVSTYGTGRNGWSGYGVGSRHCFMGDGTTVGIHDNINSWCISFDGSRNCSIPGNLSVGGTISGALNIIPRGVILLWSGAQSSIPSGWRICDGGDGTPDLRDRFVVGAGSSYSPGNTGGASTVTLTTTQIPPHSHGGSTDGRCASNSGGGGCGQMGYGDDYQCCGSTFGISTDSRYGNSGGGTDSHENRPPYYALCYIMKT